MAQFEGTLYTGNLAITGTWSMTYTVNQTGDINSFSAIITGIEEGRSGEAWSVLTETTHGLNITTVIEE